VEQYKLKFKQLRATTKGDMTSRKGMMIAARNLLGWS